MRELSRLLSLRGLCIGLLMALAFLEVASAKDLYKSSKLRSKLGKSKKLSKEKDKLALWAETAEAKKKLKLKSASVLKTKSGGIDMGEDTGERSRLCESRELDALPDFFLKFGTLTGLISDVNDFKRELKASETRKKRLWRKQSGGGGSDKYLTKDKQSGLRPTKYQFKHNYLGSKKASRRDNYGEALLGKPGKVSQCYGYGLLSAVDGLVLEGDGAADIATLSEAVMEVEDIALAKDLGEAIDKCGEQTDDENINNVCPVSSTLGIATSDGSCPENCVSDSECDEAELCCPNACGGNACYNPTLLQSKYRSADDPFAAKQKKRSKAGGAKEKARRKKKNRKKNKCRKADLFVQCLYDAIGSKVCD